MNKTRMPKQTKILKPKRLQSSQLPARQSPFPIVPDQIHKVPQNVRKAIKVGKYRRNSSKIPNPEQTESQFYSDNIDEREKIKIDLQVKPIFQLYAKKSSQSELKEQNQDQVIIQNFRNEGPKFRASGDRMLYVKKKLTPLKKGLAVQPVSIQARSKRNLKITFLNIEKLQLVKMYENMNDNNHNNSKNQFSPVKKSAAMTSSLVSKSNNDFLVENFLQSTTFSSKTNTNFRKSFHEKSPGKQKLKPFVPPFEKYSYLDFIWKVALDNGQLLSCPQVYNHKFKIFIGKGNNSLLIKSLFKRRNGWWCFTDKYEDANFVWAQIKINQIFNLQQNNSPVYKSINDEEEDQNNLDLLNRQKQSYVSQKKIMNDQNILLWNQYFTKYRRVEDKLTETMDKRNKVFSMLKQFKKINKEKLIIHNHLPNNYVIGNKKALFYTMSKYYEKTNQNLFNYLPLTFHIQNGLQDNEYLKFLNHFYARAKKIRAKENAKKNGTVLDEKDIECTKSTRNMWILKPGQFTNRGNGITVCMNLDQIKKILKKRERHDNGNLKTYIIQSYLEKPFLYQRRKFDIRHFMMISSVDGRIKGYWYEYGYIRTTSFQYSVNNNLTSVHLTNDAVQKYLPEYGKYEKGNKISYEDFQKYLDKQYSGKYDFFGNIYPKIKKIATDSIKACSLTIDPQRKGHNFQIFGLDFMIDSDFHPWLIQINNNPCLQLSCPLLNGIVPDMVESAFRICVDSLIPPAQKIYQKKPKFNDNAFEKNKFELVYDSYYEEQALNKLYNGQYVLQLDYKQLEKQQDEVFEDEGIELDD